MNQEEIAKRLRAGEELGLVLYAAELASGIKVKRSIGLVKKRVKTLGLQSWHYLQENPSYVREQKIIRTRPYLISLMMTSDAPQLMDVFDIYFVDLEEVDVFLQQFDKSLTDFQTLSDLDFSI